MKTCAQLLTAFGWHCRAIDDAHYISTPIVLGCGKPLDFYITTRDGRMAVTDDGLTLFTLRSMGYALDDRRNWRPIAGAIQPFGLQLTDHGEITAEFPEADLPIWGHRLLAAFAAVAAWDAERKATRDDDLTLTQEVERIIRARHPVARIEHEPRIVLANGTEVTFALRWDDRYIDPMAPTANAVSARVRKALLVSRDLDMANDVLFIVDDRNEPIAAERELSVLAQVAAATRLTAFSELARGARH